MVALSPSAAEELGFQISDEDKRKSFIEMSGRKGLGVKADDLLNRMEANAFEEVAKRNPEFAVEKQKIIAHQIAVGALRYFLLKFTRNTVIVFDFKEALSFEGETGVYCQYATVSINSIFRKLAEKGENIAITELKIRTRTKFRRFSTHEGGNEIWSLVHFRCGSKKQSPTPSTLTKPRFWRNILSIWRKISIFFTTITKSSPKKIKLNAPF